MGIQDFSQEGCAMEGMRHLVDDIKYFFKRTQDKGRLKSRKDIKIYSKHHTA